MIGEYLHKKAEHWVSVVVLVGCVAITGVLVYTAFEANALGGKYIKHQGFSTLNQ